MDPKIVRTISVTSRHKQTVLSYNPLEPLIVCDLKKKKNALALPFARELAHKGIPESLKERTFQSNLTDKGFLIAFPSSAE